MKLEFQEYRAHKIVNAHRHVDGPWFWDKYSAQPYVGCRSGCEFCYLRRRDPDTFDTLIQVKINAVELLRKELSRLDNDVVACGDWQQPADDHYRLSRGMLEVVRSTKDHGGSFVLAGGLTMDGIQAERTLEAARRFDPAMESRLRELYNWSVGEKPSYAPPRAYTAQLGLTEFGRRTISQILE
jgi:hypothetical protein